MAMNPISWGADTDISMPEPTEPVENEVDLGGGYVFSRHGLRHNFTRADAEVYFAPTWAPLPSPEAAGS